MNKNTLSAFVAVVLAILLTASCSSGSSWVKVQGNKFIGPDGKELVFRGLCFSDPVKLVRGIFSSFTEPVPGRLLAKI